MSTASEKNSSVILLVEDDQSLRWLMRRALDQSGFDVVEVDTGTRALASLERGGIDVVVLDLGLPDSRAPDVLAWLHAHDEQPPWLVISAVDRADAVRIDSAISGRFVAKPFDPWKLLERITALTDMDEEGATR
ncbi:MAG: response regulator [Chloroflexi bacterium]|nr:response regulator [Chloroflexota bacterium]